jgi:hypothetical protein
VTNREAEIEARLTARARVVREAGLLFMAQWDSLPPPITDALDGLASELDDAAAELRVARQERDEANEHLTTALECDCVYAPVSSFSCQKCGRRGVITREHWLRIVKDANEAIAARQETETLREALDGITALRREGRYNTAEECRAIARAALASPVPGDET